MGVLLLTVLLLFVAPGLLYVLGRAIDARYSFSPGRPPVAAVDAPQLHGDEWFMRPMRPLFETIVPPGGEVVDVAKSPYGITGQPVAEAWFRRPLPPLFSRKKSILF